MIHCRRGAPVHHGRMFEPTHRGSRYHPSTWLPRNRRQRRDVERRELEYIARACFDVTVAPGESTRSIRERCFRIAEVVRNADRRAAMPPTCDEPSEPS